MSNIKSLQDLTSAFESYQEEVAMAFRILTDQFRDELVKANTEIARLRSDADEMANERGRLDDQIADSVLELREHVGLVRGPERNEAA